MRNGGIVAGLVTLLAASSAAAGVNTWTRIGPPAACVNDLAVAPGNPQIVYAASPAGVWKSTDGGATWVATGVELRARTIWRVAGVGAAGDVVLAAARGSGAWRSTDGGANWSLAVAAPADGSWGSVAAAPSDPLVAYYADDGGCYRSTDGGATWANTGPGRPWSNDLAIKPDDSSTFLLAAGWRVCVSSDGGATEICQSMNGWVTDVAFDPGAPGTALAAVFSDGVWRSTDGGQTWARSDPAPGETEVWSVGFAADGSGVAWAGARGGRLYRSTDRGATWSAVATNAALGTGRCLLATAGSGGRVFFAAAPGLLLSTDQGATWSPAISGLGASGTYAVAFSGTTNPRLYVGTEGSGVYSTTDGGATWDGPGTGLFASGFVGRIGGLAESADRAVVGAWSAWVAPLDIGWTTDGGATWSWTTAGVGAPPGDADWFSVAITSDPARLLGASSLQYLYLSTDGGASWKVPVVGATAVGTVPWSGSTVLAAGENLNGQGEGVWLSTDQGDHWRWLSQYGPGTGWDVTMATPDRPDITAAFSPNTLQVIPWVTGDYRPLLTREITVAGTGALRAVAADHSDPDVLAAGTRDAGVLRTTDGRRTWRPLDAGLDDPRVMDLDADPGNPRRLVAATPSGVYMVDLVPPEISGLTPSSVPAGSPDTVVEVSGTGFGPDVVVTLDGAEGATVRSGPELVHVTVPEGLLAKPGIVGLAAVSSGVQSKTVPLVVRFLDVPEGHWAYRFVHLAAEHGVTAGCGGGDYCPGDPVTRAQMAVFLLASRHGVGFVPSPCTGVFADVPCPGHWAADWIEELWREGITAGCGGGNFCPEQAVTRAQMAVFLLAARDGRDYAPPPCAGAFSDVPCPGYWAADWIEELAREGITAGCGGGRYCPEDPVTRAQMAVFLAAAFGWTFPGL